MLICVAKYVLDHGGKEALLLLMLKKMALEGSTAKLDDLDMRGGKQAVNLHRLQSLL